MALLIVGKPRAPHPAHCNPGLPSPSATRLSAGAPDNSWVSHWQRGPDGANMVRGQQAGQRPDARREHDPRLLLDLTPEDMPPQDRLASTCSTSLPKPPGPPQKLMALITVAIVL